MELKSDDKILAGLSHLTLLLNWIGVVITLVIYLTHREKSRFVADHAKQALGYQISLVILGLLLTPFFVGAFVSSMLTGRFEAMMGMSLGFIAFVALFALGLVAYAVYASIKAFSGEEFRYAIIGNWVARL